MSNSKARITRGEHSSERLLLDELSHRVNNQLSAAIGLVSVAVVRTRSDDVVDHLLRIKCQLENFARVQQLLQVPHFRTRVDGLAYLRQLCPALHGLHLESRAVELVLREHALSIDSEECWTLGLILAELVTNASKHAFRERPGRVLIDVVRSDSLVRCRVEDNGLCAAPPRGAHGLQIIDALTRKLGGIFQQDFAPHGCTSTLWFPKAERQ